MWSSSVAPGSPRSFFLIAFPLCLTGAAAHVMDAGSLLAAFDLPWVITIPEFAFITALSITNDRLPPRLSTGGIRARGTRLFRYDLDVRWDQIERIWVSRQAMDTVLVRLRDPESIAGATHGCGEPCAAGGSGSPGTWRSRCSW